MKINSGKSRILLSGNGHVSVHIDNNAITSENKNELLGIVLDSKLSFEDHVNGHCKKASQKLNALARIAPIGNIPILTMAFTLDVSKQKP